MIVSPSKSSSSSRRKIFDVPAVLKSHGSIIDLDCHGKNGRSIASATLGPMTIIGGTAAIYSAALRHSSSTLTPLSVFYLLLLAVQYSIMPRISKKFVDKRANKESVALVEEVVKMSMGVGLFLTGSDISSLKEWSISSSLMGAGLPSILYAIQGVLTYTAYQNLDPVTFNGLTQVKTLSAALCCFLVMGKVQSNIQIFALALLSLSTLIFQGTISKFISSKQEDARNTDRYTDVSRASSSSSKSSSTIIKSSLTLGLMPCLAATFISGLAGALSQKGLQIVGGSGRNAYLYTVEISFFSAVCLLASILLKKGVASGQTRRQQRQRQAFSNCNVGATEPTPPTTISNSTSSKYGIAGHFEYWSWKTFIPIFVKAAGGILTALVHKHAGSVVKGFALVLGLVFSGVFQTIIDDRDLSFDHFLGTSLVLLSSWLHFTNPAVAAIAPTI